MNIKRIIFWICFVGVILLIVWGMIVAMGKPVPGQNLAEPAPVTAADHVRGLENAPVTIIEYSDFQCPACKTYYSLIERVLNDSSTTVRFVYRHYPLPQHQNAIPAAVASEAAAMQGKFWEMYSKIFSNYDDWAELADARKVFEGYATDIGLNLIQFKADTSGTTTKATVMANLAEGQSIGINSTPTFFVNGKAIVNPQSYEAFIQIIQASAKGNSK